MHRISQDSLATYQRLSSRYAVSDLQTKLVEAERTDGPARRELAKEAGVSPEQILELARDVQWVRSQSTDVMSVRGMLQGKNAAAVAAPAGKTAQLGGHLLRAPGESSPPSAAERKALATLASIEARRAATIERIVELDVSGADPSKRASVVEELVSMNASRARARVEVAEHERARLGQYSPLGPPIGLGLAASSQKAFDLEREKRDLREQFLRLQDEQRFVGREQKAVERMQSDVGGLMDASLERLRSNPKDAGARKKYGELVAVMVQVDERASDLAKLGSSLAEGAQQVAEALAKLG